MRRVDALMFDDRRSGTSCRARVYSLFLHLDDTNNLGRRVLKADFEQNAASATLGL